MKQGIQGNVFIYLLKKYSKNDNHYFVILIHCMLHHSFYNLKTKEPYVSVVKQRKEVLNNLIRVSVLFFSLLKDGSVSLNILLVFETVTISFVIKTSGF